MILQVKYFDCNNGKVIIEMPFWQHIVALKKGFGKHVDKFVVVLIEVNNDFVKKHGTDWVTIDPKSEGIEICSSYIVDEIGDSKLSKLKNRFIVSARIRKLVRQADIIHTGMAYDFWLPTSFFAVINAIRYRKKLVYVVDIDFRNNSKMLLHSGTWGLGTFLVSKLVYDTHKKLQLAVATRYADLSLLKGKKFANDYSVKGKNVRYFLNSVHEEDCLINESQLVTKLGSLQNPDNPLRMLYFGRIVHYKGIHDALDALSKVKPEYLKNIRLTIIGDGEERIPLVNKVSALGLKKYVNFLKPIVFGKDLFNEIRKYDLLIALPQREDTPRSALDAMAVGLPLLAYNTYYYNELGDYGAVILTDWRDIRMLAEEITELTMNKTKLIEKSKNAVAFARQNTQSVWLAKRINWTKEIFDIES